MPFAQVQLSTSIFHVGIHVAISQSQYKRKMVGKTEVIKIKKHSSTVNTLTIVTNKSEISSATPHLWPTVVDSLANSSMVLQHVHLN